MANSPQESPYDFERLARRLGQYDPQVWRWEPRANDNKPPAKPATPADLIVGFALGAVIGAATLYILFFN
jgi:hypothetical protein